MSKPKKLYKYEAFTVQSLKNLKSQTLYFGSPLNFNDPYDCAIRPKLSEPTGSDIEILRNFLYRNNDFPLETRNALKEANNDDLKKFIKNVAEENTYSLIERRMKNIGVTCFAERNDDHLMWSHYADRQTGFCLEFDTSQEPFSKVREVDYQDVYPEISMVDALINNNYGQFINLLYIKSNSWKYEKEWRCIHKVAGTCFNYETEALKGVYFGPEIDDDSLDIICLILRGQNPNVKFWKGERSLENFSIKFSQFNYLSYLERQFLDK